MSLGRPLMLLTVSLAAAYAGCRATKQGGSQVASSDGAAMTSGGAPASRLDPAAMKVAMIGTWRVACLGYPGKGGAAITTLTIDEVNVTAEIQVFADLGCQTPVTKIVRKSTYQLGEPSQLVDESYDFQTTDVANGKVRYTTLRLLGKNLDIGTGDGQGNDGSTAEKRERVFLKYHAERVE